MPPEKCTRCDKEAFLVNKSHRLCEFHARSQRIRNNAISKGKTCPDKHEIERMMLDNVGFTCEHCGKTMGMTEREFGRSRVVTLQHNSNGTFSLYCFSCNARHGVIGDSFLGEPPTMKRCHICKQTLPLDRFNKGPGFCGRNTKCKICQSESNKEQYQKRKIR